MPRALLIVLDSVGIGGAEDADVYGDAGADTVGHIAEACAAGRGDRAGLRHGPLHLPNMAALGLGLACEASTGRLPPNLAPAGALTGAWGYGVETSKGKDTPSGHWEMTGAPVVFDWGYFPDTVPSFPPRTHRGADPGGGAFPGFSATSMPRERPSSTNSAPSISARASRSSTPPSTACCRSRRMRKHSGCSGSTICA